jgi:hypothetical protein
MINIVDIDTIGDYIKHTCKISKSYIMFKLNNDTASLDKVDFNWDYPKLIMNLIKNGFDNIVDNYKDIEYFQYTINIDELEYIDKTKFTHHYDRKNNVVTLKCSMSNAFNNFIQGFITE